MGREIRRVPPHWKHPKVNGHNKPMLDEDYAQARKDWIQGLMDWESGKHPDKDEGEFWEYAGDPPKAEDYRPWEEAEATWYQLWETVSEGTPISPPFATKEELAQHLAKHGDDWDQKRGKGGWGIERARAFVEAGYAPTMMISDGRIYESSEIPQVLKREART